MDQRRPRGSCLRSTQRRRVVNGSVGRRTATASITSSLPRGLYFLPIEYVAQRALSQVGRASCAPLPGPARAHGGRGVASSTIRADTRVPWPYRADCGIATQARGGQITFVGSGEMVCDGDGCRFQHRRPAEGLRTVGTSVGLLTGIRARWNRVDLRRIPMGAWLASRRGGGVSPRSGRPIAAGVGFRTWCATRLPAATLISAAPYRGARCSRRRIGSVSRNRGRLSRRDAVFRVHHRRGRIWRATIKTAIIKTAIIKTWGGATAQANGYDGSCGGEREQTHDGLLLSWPVQIILVCSS
jgi:hypothetical protein